MGRRRRTTSVHTADADTKQPRRRPLKVLIADDDPAVRQLITEAAGDAIQCFVAATLADARRILSGGPVDMAFIDDELADGAGLDLLAAMRKRHPGPQVIMLCEHRRFDTAVNAMRQGVSDILVKPLNHSAVSKSLDSVLQRSRDERKREQRLRRLQRACRKLNDARQEISQQVDVLCSDLVTAYQELANQMQHVVQASEYAALVRHELDLEQLLRKTLEHVLEKAGPTNAAIFLPSSMDEYSLGGYINYDQTGGSPDVLLQHLADVAAPKLVDRTAPLLITDNSSLNDWLGDDADYLEDCHVIGLSCQHDNECLAVVVLFRDGSQPFSTDALESMGAVAPLLAENLARIIRVHHRCSMHSDFETPDDPMPF